MLQLRPIASAVDLDPTALLTAILRPQQTIALAVSGGPDSQVLIDWVGRHYQKVPFCRVIAIGIDHGLRAAAALELQLAAELCYGHGIAFVSRRVTVASGGNLLFAARTARYRLLRCLMRGYGAHMLLLGHHADDQLETILWRLCRGTTLRGLGGMHAKTQWLRRPLLSFSKNQLLAYAKARNLRFAEDPSNNNQRTSRGHCRHILIPQLKQLNHQYLAHVSTFTQLAQWDEAVLARLSRRWLNRVLLPSHALQLHLWRKLPPALAIRVLRLWLQQHTAFISLQQLLTLQKALLSGHTGRLSLGGQCFLVTAQSLQLKRATPLPAVPVIAARPLTYPSRTTLAPLKCDLVLEPYAWPEQLQSCHLQLADNHTIACDRAHLNQPLSLRVFQPGDRLYPGGGRGHIKVGDLFTNYRIPRQLRSVWPLLFHGNNLLWVVGLRRGCGLWATAATKQILLIQLQPTL